MRIQLGWDGHARSQFGFENQDTPAPSPISHDGEAPITIIASTGSGKGRDLLVPLLLTQTNPAIVLDMKGELSKICARRRREMGNRVVIIDPFDKVGGEDRLNPLDLLGLEGAQVDCDAEMIASQLGEGHDFASDMFWTDTGSSLVAGVIACIASTPGERSLARVREMLFCDDVDYQLAVMLDKAGKEMHPFAYAEISAYLQIGSDKTRPSVLSTARTFLKSLNSASVAACLEDSTFSLEEVIAGAPLDVFIIITPDKVLSHAGLLRILVGTLLTAMTRRTEIPERPTMVVVDEAAQLGKEFGPLLTASTLMRGYGVQLISAWQDVAQIKSWYKTDWATILNNSGAILAFGIGHYGAAKDAAEFLGLEPSELMRLKPHEAVLSMRGEGLQRVRRMNYLEDERFKGLYYSGPRFLDHPASYT